MTPPLLAFYGDDFTGSADVMEVLQWSGMRTVLFLEPPSPEQLSRFPGLRAFGVAGTSRTMSPTRMEGELKPIFESLRAANAAIVHYKTCSTFDSSPQIGSIGKAIELGRDVFQTQPVPLLIAAPGLGRYQAFGNLFARSGLDTEPFRLDRHPTMCHHPITPMTEADTRVHLAKQTDLTIELVDCVQIEELAQGANGAELSHSRRFARDSQVLLFDAVYPRHMPRIGEIIDGLAGERSPLFTVGSSGIEYALTAHWFEQETDGGPSKRSHSPGRPTFDAIDQLVALTGSCSPVNARQIDWAEANGFETLPIDAARLVDEGTWEKEVNEVAGRALECLSRGANLIIHSSRGPRDPRVAKTLAALANRGLSEVDIRLRSGHILGPKLGQILKLILASHPLGRVGVAGGDTSGYVARALGIEALEALAPVAPGSPLCRVHSRQRIDGSEIFFKGGQVGHDDVWGTMLRGTAPDAN